MPKVLISRPRRMARLSGEKLRRAMAERRRSIEGVADRAGIASPTVRKALRGEAVSIPVAAAIARAVGVQVKDLAPEMDRGAETNAA